MTDYQRVTIWLQFVVESDDDVVAWKLYDQEVAIQDAQRSAAHWYAKAKALANELKDHGVTVKIIPPPPDNLPK